MHKYRVNEKDLCFNCKILTNTNQRFLYYKYHLYDLQGWEKGTTLIQQECWNCTWINAWREFKWIFILPQEPGIFIFQKLMWSYQCRDTHSPGFSRNISVPDSTGRSCFMPHKSNTEFPFKTVCGSTHIATFLLAVTHHSNTLPLLPILLLLQTPVSAQLQAKRHFPSQHLNKRIYATSHAYQTYQLTNGGQVEQREFCI